MNVEIIIVINNLYAQRNSGVVISALRKMRLIEDAWGIKPALFITDYNPDLAKICKILSTGGSQRDLLSKDAKILSVGDENNPFSDNMERAAACLDQITQDPSKIYFVIAEDGQYSPALSRLKKPNLILTCVVHSIFLENPYDLSSGPQPYYTALCERYSAYDGIVFLTNWERVDFIKKYPEAKNTFTIPHPYPYEICPSDFKTRDGLKAVMAARLREEKGIDTAIDIFRLVADQLPNARLDIYGSGEPEYEAKCLTQIKRLRLENNVFLMGYTSDPISVFQGAALSMMTSVAEGFGLTLMESISNGCPAFAFDIKYGPSDVIIDGVTGYLFPYGDNAAYAGKLLEYFNSQALRQSMSEAAYHDARRFSKALFLRKWNELIESLYKRRYGDDRLLYSDFD